MTLTKSYSFSDLVAESVSSLLLISLVIVGIGILFFLVLATIVFVFGFFFIGVLIASGFFVGLKLYCLI